jgi:hypothetical protein
MSRPGRPIRVLGWLIGGWVVMRAALLLIPTVWSIAGPDEPERYVDYRSLRDGGGPLPPARTAQAAAIRIAMPAIVAGHGRVAGLPGAGLGGAAIPGVGWTSQTADLMMEASLGFVAPRRNGGLIDRLTRMIRGSEGRATAMAGTGVPIAPGAGSAGRWSGTAWMLWRPDVGSSFAQAPLLGGSQAGGRIDYRLTSGRAGQLSLYGRVSRALTGPSSEEGALGVALRPGRLPVSLLAERRQRLGPGGRNGFALLAAGGMGPRDLVPRVEAEGYAQAGLVGLPGLDGFADGKASLSYRLTPTNERRSLTLGASLSGSVQPGAGRVDIGPELRLRLPLGATAMRLSTEWRERIVGDARPARGPAITLVADF